MSRFPFRVPRFSWSRIGSRCHGAGAWWTWQAGRWTLAPLFVSLLAFTACGYHTGGRAVLLPSDLHTISVPVFANRTNTYRIDDLLTQAVVHEFLARTQYRVVSQPDPQADAVLNGVVTGTSVSPVTYDSVTGHVSSVLVTINVSVTLRDRNGKVLYSSPGYMFRDQYEVLADPSTFFLEETPALQRLSQDFARTLVSNILEAY